MSSASLLASGRRASAEVIVVEGGILPTKSGSVKVDGRLDSVRLRWQSPRVEAEHLGWRQGQNGKEVGIKVLNIKMKVRRLLP